MPAAVHRVLGRTRSASVESLFDAGVIPSAEVLAELIPGISSAVLTASYPDLTLARLMGRNYQAFRRRRSLLLLDLANQVQLAELPWVRATEPYREAAQEQPLAVVRRVGALALDHFPGTILPNPLVRELDHLLHDARVDVPLTEELAADIFMGRFSPKFGRAAEVAARVLAGSLYARYYDLDARPEPLSGPPVPGPRWMVRLNPFRTEPDAFASWCLLRAGRGQERWSSVAANGTVIEQAQILTTHNLAALVAAGVTPTRPWLDLAESALAHAWSLLRRAQAPRHPLAPVKDAAYAWRQALFFASMVPAGTAAEWARATTPPDLAPASSSLLLGGLRHVAEGGRFDAAGRCDGGRRFVGWTTERPWVLDTAHPAKRRDSAS